MIDIDPVVLEGLKAHCEEIGKADAATVADYLNSDDAAVTEAYRQAMAPAKPAKKQKPAAAAAAEAKSEPTTYHFLNDDNVLSDLEVVRIKNGRVILRHPTVTDFVSIALHGDSVVVDVEVIKKLSEAAIVERYGVTSEVLNLLISAARPK